MRNYRGIFVIILFTIFANQSVIADIPRYIDVKYLLNKSIAGEKAQNYLKKKFEDGEKSLKNKEIKILEEEKKIIQQKKLISAEEYKKKVDNLRKKVSDLQKEKNKFLENISKQRSKARAELLKNLNPILKDYMIEKKIRMVIHKKDLIVADENLDITKDIINILNKKLKTIKLN